MTFAKQLIDGLGDPTEGTLAPRFAIRSRRRGGPRSGVRRGLKAFVLMSLAVAVVVAGTGLMSVRAAHNDANQVRVLMTARNHVSDMGRGVNDLRINVNRAMLGSQGIGTLTAAEAGRNLVAGATRIGNELAALEALSLSSAARQPIAALTTLLTAFVTQADRLSGLAFSDIDAASLALPAFGFAAAEIDARGPQRRLLSTR